MAFGLMEDLMTGRFIGLNAICKGLTGFIVGLMSERLYKNNFSIPVITVFVATFLHGIIYVCCGAVIGLNLEGPRIDKNSPSSTSKST